MHLVAKPRLLVSLALLVSLSALAVSGCGGGQKSSAPQTTGTTHTSTTPGKTVNAAAVESALERNFKSISLPAVPTTIYPRGGGTPQQSQIGGGELKVRSVTCPRDVPVKAGGTFDCSVDAANATATVRLTQLNSSGTKLRYDATFKSEVTTGVSATTRVHGNITVVP